MDYYQKYLKYKTKYLELKKQLGGKCNKCRCPNSFSTREQNKSPPELCGSCNHSKKNHTTKQN